MYILPSLLCEVAPALRQNHMNLLEYVEMICKHLDAHEGKIQSLVPEVNRNARLIKEAEALLEKYPDPRKRPLLFGVLIGVKDNIRVKGFPTRVGSKLPPALFVGEEAPFVSRCRNNGAIILGKTVTTEFTLGNPGLTRNPHNLEHTPGGSSSGSAAAVAAGFCPLAFGTQTGGSVIRPAAFCGVVGFKPTYQRIPVQGMIHYSFSLDHIGLFTQEIRGMILAVSIVFDRWDGIEGDINNRLPVVGVPEGPYLELVESETLDSFNQTIRALRSSGYKVKFVSVLNNLVELLDKRKKLALGELAEIHEEWFANHKDLYTKYTAQRIMMGKEVRAEELNALRYEVSIFREKKGLMKELGIDLLIAPSALGPAPIGLSTTGDSIMNKPWSYTGHPVITLPTGFTEREQMPLGVQLIGSHWNDEKLLSWASAIAEVIGSCQEDLRASPEVFLAK